MKARMSRESAQHIVAEQKSNGITTDGIIALFVNRAYDSLGYPTFSYFLDAELRTELESLADTERAEIANGMRAAGCSLRAISSVVKWSHTTVKNRTALAIADTPPTIGADGVAYRQPRSRKTFGSAVLDAGWEFRMAAEKLTDLIYDDRFEAVRDDVTDQLRSHLLVGAKAVDTQLDTLGKAHT